MAEDWYDGFIRWEMDQESIKEFAELNEVIVDKRVYIGHLDFDKIIQLTNLDIKYNGFIKDNIMLILDNINKLFFNFNLKYGSTIKPTVFSIFRILDSLKIIKADKIEIFYDTELEEFYPEVFEIECVSR